MSIALITGSAGLVGAEAVACFAEHGFTVIGIDNNMRREFFGEEASTEPARRALEARFRQYIHVRADVRDRVALEAIFAEYSSDIQVVIHAAAQPSHDWAARDPHVDFSVNAMGTLNLLECTRRYCPQASFLFTSTNKVYGDNPNRLPLVETETRWEIDPDHPFAEHGIDESMSVDQTNHSLFGASKLAADALVQEYGRCFGLNTACFRGGCLTGPGHAGTMLHGFLAYLVKCVVTRTPYTILGYRGKQVRDNLHVRDLIHMFWHYHQQPRPGAVYNVGGGQHSNCSVREAIALCEVLTGAKAKVTYVEAPRRGDHMWYISDVRKFRCHFPRWHYEFDLRAILLDIIAAHAEPGVISGWSEFSGGQHGIKLDAVPSSNPATAGGGWQ